MIFCELILLLTAKRSHRGAVVPKCCGVVQEEEDMKLNRQGRLLVVC